VVLTDNLQSSSSLLMVLTGSAPSGRGESEQEAAEVRNLWQEFAPRRLEAPRPESQHSIDRMSELRGSVDDEWGRSESVDPDNVGDVADEGAGHRG
jgi:hypothetical protein